jgi:hypothetical protein
MTTPFKPTPAFKNKKWKEAIKLLNDIVKIKIAPSPIHGVGVFAMRNMKKGEKLEADAIPHAFDLPFKKLGDLKPEVREVILSHWPTIINGSHFLYPVTKMTAFLNHDSNPNYDAKEDKLLRAVKAGEEITENYREIENIEKVYKWLAK